MVPEQVILADGRQVVLIHFMQDSRIVCMPGLRLKDMGTQMERQAPHMSSNHAGAVTCPMCKKSSVWQRAPNK